MMESVVCLDGGSRHVLDAGVCVDGGSRHVLDSVVYHKEVRPAYR